MTPNRRPIALIALLAAGFSTIFLLPESYGLRDSAVIKTLPEQLGGGWEARLQETPERVAAILGEATFHQQASYLRRDDGGLYERLSLFMVVSGDDMNASIHRPERCFPTQGITISDSSEISVPLDSGGVLPVTRLASEVLTKDGVRVPRLSYYWFVGSDQLTNSHYERAWIDIRDRVFKGDNQRWGYIMASTEFGLEQEGLKTVDEAGADAMLQEFLTRLFPHVHRVDQLAGLEG